MLNSVGEWIGERILPDVKTYKGGAVKLGNDKIVYGTDMGSMYSLPYVFMFGLIIINHIFAHSLSD